MTSKKENYICEKESLVELNYVEQMNRGLVGKLCGYLRSPHLNQDPRKPIIGSCVISECGFCTYRGISDDYTRDCHIKAEHQRKLNRHYVWTLEQKAKKKKLSDMEQWVIDRYYQQIAEKKRRKQQKSN